MKAPTPPKSCVGNGLDGGTRRELEKSARSFLVGKVRVMAETAKPHLCCKLQCVAKLESQAE